MFWHSLGKQLFPRLQRVRRSSGGAYRLRSHKSKLGMERLEDRSVPAGVSFLQQAGGVLADAGLAIAADDAGNVYVAGKTQGPVEVPGLTHGVLLPGFGDEDAFVASYKPTGEIRWAKHLGGKFRDGATAITVDHKGHVFVAGFFGGTFELGSAPSPASFDTIIRPDAPTSHFGNGFVARMNAATGVVQWVREADSYAGVSPGGIAVDNAGNVYSAGGFGNQVQFETNGQGHFTDVIPSAINNTDNSYLMKQDASGKLLWHTEFGTSDGNSGGDGGGANCIAVDGTGTNIYVGGTFRSILGGQVDFNTPGKNDANLRLTPAGYSDLFVERFDAAGASLWAVQAGSPNPFGSESLQENAAGIALDSQGNLYMAGNVTGVAQLGNFTVTTGGPGPNGVIAKLDSTGQFLWADGLIGPGIGVAQAIAVRNGLVYSAGWFTQSVDFDPSSQSDSVRTAAGPGDAFISVLNLSGQYMGALQQGGPGVAAGYGIAVDPAGFVDTTGLFEQMAQFGPFNRTSAGDSDLYVYRRKLELSPTHTEIIDGHILRLTGNEQANHIVITDDRHWGITVELDTDAPRTFHNIDRVEVIAAGGNDVVMYQLGIPDTLGTRDTRRADLMFDTGAGDDQVNLLAILDGSGAPAPAQSHVEVFTGTGNDVFRSDLRGSIQETTYVDLGPGHNKAIGQFEIDDWSFDVENKTTIGSATGQNTITVEYDFLESAFAAPGGTRSAPLSLNIDCGGSNSPNDIKVIYDFNPQPEPPGMPADFNIPLMTSIQGGNRADNIRVTYGLTEEKLPTGWRVAAPISLYVNGNGGADNIFVGMAVPPPDPEQSSGGPTFIFDAAVSMDIFGGLGNDTMSVNVGPDPGDPAALARKAPQLNSYMHLLMDGGNGNDLLAANLSLGDGSARGQLDVQLFGGDDRDDLTLGIVGLNGTGVLRSVIDGGDGIDTAHHTPNVRVVNCER